MWWMPGWVRCWAGSGSRLPVRAAARVAAELDAASVVARMEAAVKRRRVTVRPAPDGMAYLSVLGPLKDVVGAYAAVQAQSRAVVSGQCPGEGPQGRGVGAVAADTALALLSGRAAGQVQPVEVHLVMTDRALLGTGDPDRSVFEPARVPGHGSRAGPGRAGLAARRPGGLHRAGVPECRSATGRAAAATRPARVWVRRLYTSPDGRDLVAMDSRRRLFGGLLRRMLVLRDDVCTTPWCEAPIVHADHTTPAREGGPTSFRGGCRQVRPLQPGQGSPRLAHRVTVLQSPRGPERARRDDGGLGRRVVQVTTPLGHRYVSEPPPLLGWGSTTSPSATGWTVPGQPQRAPEARPGRRPNRTRRRGRRRPNRTPRPGRRRRPAPGVTPARRTSASGRCGDARRSATRLPDAHA